MRNRLKTLGAPVWGTKAQMWPRLVHAEARREIQKRDEACLADRARELAEARGQGELRVPRAPDEPSADERARHEVTHLTVPTVVCMVRHGERSCKTPFAATSGKCESPRV